MEPPPGWSDTAAPASGGLAVWKYRIGTTIETSPALAPDGTLYMGADNGKLYAIAPPGFPYLALKSEDRVALVRLRDL